MSKKTLYDIREYVGLADSKGLGNHLRPYRRAAKIAHRFKKQSRDIVLIGMKINLNIEQESRYQFTPRSWVDIVPINDNNPL
jgi:hypothetical protein